MLRAAIANQFCELLCDFLRHLISVDSSGIFANLNKSTHILIYQFPEVVEPIIERKIPNDPSSVVQLDNNRGNSLSLPTFQTSPLCGQPYDNLDHSSTEQSNLFWCCAFILPYCICASAPNIVAIPPPANIARPTIPISMNMCSTVCQKRSVLLLSNPLEKKSNRNSFCSFQMSKADAEYDKEQQSYYDMGMKANMCIHFIAVSDRSSLLIDAGPHSNPDNRRRCNDHLRSHCMPSSKKEICIIERTTMLTNIDEIMPTVNIRPFLDKKLDDERKSSYEVKTVECFGMRVLICTSTNIDSTTIDTHQCVAKVDGKLDNHIETADSLVAWNHLCVFGAIAFEQGFIPSIQTSAVR